MILWKEGMLLALTWIRVGSGKLNNCYSRYNTHCLSSLPRTCLYELQHPTWDSFQSPPVLPRHPFWALAHSGCASDTVLLLEPRPVLQESNCLKQSVWRLQTTWMFSLVNHSLQQSIKTSVSIVTMINLPDTCPKSKFQRPLAASKPWQYSWVTGVLMLQTWHSWSQWQSSHWLEG